MGMLEDSVNSLLSLWPCPKGNAEKKEEGIFHFPFPAKRISYE